MTTSPDLARADLARVDLTGTGASGTDLPRTAWDDELDRMEADVAAARTLLPTAAGPATVTPQDDTFDAYAADDASQDWAPPTDLGPLPVDLLPRAVSVLAGQHEVVDALTRALAATTRQRSFTAKVAGATVNAAAPAYLDVSA